MVQLLWLNNCFLDFSGFCGHLFYLFNVLRLFLISGGSMWAKVLLRCTNIRPHVSHHGQALATGLTCQSTPTPTSLKTCPNPAAPSVQSRLLCWAAAPAHPCHQLPLLSQQCCPNPAHNLRLPPARPLWRSPHLLTLLVSVYKKKFLLCLLFLYDCKWSPTFWTTTMP